MANPRNIDPSIHELLFDNDCVIVPNFGGFVGLYHSSSISADGKIISPPTKSVSFNRKLKTNDGLLANHIAKSKEISFEMAMLEIEKDVKDLDEDLKKDNRIEIAGVGVIYVDKEEKYRFLPNAEINFLKSSYGLQSLQARPIEKVKETPIIPLVPKEKSTKKRIWAAAVLIPVFLAGAYVLSVAIQKDDFSMASLNPFNWDSEVITSEYVPNEAAQEIQNDAESISLETIVSQSTESTVNVSFVEDTETKLMVVEVPPKAIPEEIIEVSKEITEEAKTSEPEGAIVKEDKNNTTGVIEDYTATGFFVVGGAFREYPNAQKMVRILRKEGHDSFIFGKSGSLHLVCVGQYQNKSEAKSALKKVKSAGRKEAWLKIK